MRDLYSIDKNSICRGQCETVCNWVVVDKISVKLRGYDFTRGDKVLLWYGSPCSRQLHYTIAKPILIQLFYDFSDPSDPKKQIVRCIRCSSNEWVRVSDRGSSKFIFVPRGFCALDSGPGTESPIGCHSVEVVGSKDFNYRRIVSRDSFILRS